MERLTICLDTQHTVGDAVELTSIRAGWTEAVPLRLGERSLIQSWSTGRGRRWATGNKCCGQGATGIRSHEGDCGGR